MTLQPLNPGEQGSCRVPAKVPSKAQARIPASQFQQGIIVFNCLPQKAPPRKSRSCPRIGSSKVAKQFQQSSSQTSNLTTRHIKQSKNQCKKKNEIDTRIELAPSKMFQQGFTSFQQVPAECQQCSSKVPAMFH